jgi:hypothetical protein
MALDRVVQAMTAQVVHEALCQCRRDLERAAVDRGAGGNRDERVLVARLAADAVEDLLPSLASNDMGPRGGTSVARMKSANSCTSAPAGWALSPRSSGSNHRAARMIEERRVPPAGAALDYLAGTADDRCGVALAASGCVVDRSEAVGDGFRPGEFFQRPGEIRRIQQSIRECSRLLGYSGSSPWVCARRPSW